MKNSNDFIGKQKSKNREGSNRSETIKIQELLYSLLKPLILKDVQRRQNLSFQNNDIDLTFKRRPRFKKFLLIKSRKAMKKKFNDKPLDREFSLSFILLKLKSKNLSWKEIIVLTMVLVFLYMFFK